MALKNILILTYFAISVALFATFSAPVGIWIAFFANWSALTLAMVYHIYVERFYSPFLSSYIVFTFLFFLAAPMVQIDSFEAARPKFANFFPYREAMVIKANLLVLLFNVIFLGCYFIFKKRISKTKVLGIKQSHRKTVPVTIIVIAVLCVIIFFASYEFVQDEISRPTSKTSDFSVMTQLFWKKVFFLLPFGGLLLCFQYFNQKKKIAVNTVTLAAAALFFLVILLWFKNPLVEKRNALGPIYICLILLFTPKLLNTNIKTTFFLFFSMIILFPLSAIITHSDASFKEMLKDPGILLEQMKGGGIANAFNTLNYDAFANIMATMDYVSNEGLSFGYQSLSGFLFFVPREIWEDKPYSTGQMIGDYLIDEYGFGFNNLSNPLVSEGFVNFGIIGTAIAAIILAWLIIKLALWLMSDDYLKKFMAFYFAIHLIFFLRGDFTNGFSYYVGTFIGTLMIPKLISYTIFSLSQRQHRWKKSRITES